MYFVGLYAYFQVFTEKQMKSCLYIWLGEMSENAGKVGTSFSQSLKKGSIWSKAPALTHVILLFMLRLNNR